MNLINFGFNTATTFSDALFKQVQEKAVGKATLIEKILDFAKENEYDTDTIKQDLRELVADFDENNGMNVSNLYRNCRDSSVVLHIVEFIINDRCMFMMQFSAVSIIFVQKHMYK